MLHVFLLILVYATPVDGGHRAGANGYMNFYATQSECVTAAQNAKDKMLSQATAFSEKILGGVAFCLEADVPTEVGEPTPAQPPADEPMENQNRASL